MSKFYFIVDKLVRSITVIERSKFICTIKTVKDEDDAKDFISVVRKEHSLATHNCYAYIADDLGLIQKFSDDGEPQGTAGMPILEVLKNKKLYKTAAVVTRYFGGIKLGTGGLVRAYGGCVADCLSKSKIIKVEKANYIKVFTDYEGYSKLLSCPLKKYFDITDTDFSDKVVLKLAVKGGCDELQNFSEKLNDYFCGNLTIEYVAEGFYSFKE